MSLNTPFKKGRKQGAYREVRDANGVWMFDCFDLDADEVIKRLNAPDEQPPQPDKTVAAPELTFVREG